MYHSIYDAVRAYADAQPEKPAVADKDGACTYKELYDRATAVAAALCSRGIRHGDAVVAECTQDCGFLILDLACEALGAVFVPVEAGVLPERLEEICRETEASLMVTDTICPGGCPSISPQELSGISGGCGTSFCGGAAEDVAEILFSTGTTGKPKGIVLTHKANVAVAENIVYGTQMSPEAVELVPLPLNHSHGLRTCYAHLLNGSTAVIANGVVNVGAYFELIERYKVNALDLAPTMAKVLLQVGRRGLLKYGGQIGYLELGTAMLDEDTKGRLKEVFPDARIYNFYGSTEAGRSCILDISREDFPNCVGYPSRHARFLVTDERRMPIDSSKDHPGLIAVEGDMMMQGYFNSPQLTAETLVDGRLYTSDLGYIDGEGRVYVMGRADDVINYKGIKIAPDEIEGIAKKYEGVKDCACVGIEDKLCGQIPKLYVEPYEGKEINLKQLKMFLKQNLEPSKVPPAVEAIGKLPRNPNGKLLRSVLRKRQ